MFPVFPGAVTAGTAAAPVGNDLLGGRCGSSRRPGYFIHVRYFRTEQDCLLLELRVVSQSVGPRYQPVNGCVDYYRAVSLEENGLLVAESLRKRSSQGRGFNDPGTPIVELANIKDREAQIDEAPAQTVIGGEGYRTGTESHQFRRVRVHDRVDVGPRLVNLAVNKAFQILIGTLSGDWLAVEVVFDEACRGDHARRNPARQKVMIRIGGAAHADVSGGVEETNQIGGQRAVSDHEVVNGWRCLPGRAFGLARPSTQPRLPARIKLRRR